MACRVNMTDVNDAISERDQSLIKSVYKEEGAIGFMQNKDKWKLKIAVTGYPGSGKSSFINAFRGLSANDKGAAQVGVTETINKIRSYTCTGNDQFILFDIPNVGSPKFPKATYLEDIGFNELDFFIIISSSRFTEDDAWLGEMAKEHKKKCFYVRTKIDLDISMNMEDEGDHFNAAAIIEKVRREARKCLNVANIDAPIYLITTRPTTRHTFDFASLVDDVNRSAMELKRKALRALLQHLTENVTGNTTDVYDAISEKDQSLIKSVYKEKGATGLKDVIMQNKDKWKSQPLKIAVTGNSGSG
ncbi:interferon-inducible GTPase 1-like isoform X2 [Mya arenaria]|uniref:interferon-inducible GTPase 1-like isoform X2 n=1 Tax=Mya arenaria TaxID=6604 RepID=UPI0022DEFA9C|nr:interferon-inducible GTPase 1-like isoform X2 [Mya arenaria]